MAFDIQIKPLVLFDLEDKIKLSEYKTAGEGRRLYQSFLYGLSDLQNGLWDKAPAVYETVKKYVSKDALFSLFYITTENTVLVIGLL